MFNVEEFYKKIPDFILLNCFNTKHISLYPKPDLIYLTTIWNIDASTRIFFLILVLIVW